MTDKTSNWSAAIDPRALDALAADDAAVKLMYEACRNGITAENQLVSFRLTWALTLSGGFLTAESFLIGNMLNGQVPLNSLAGKWICLMTVALSVIAAWFCWRTRLGVDAAYDQIDYLRRRLEVVAQRCEKLGLPCPHGAPSGFRRGHRTAEMIALALFVLWVLIAVSATEWLAQFVAEQGITRHEWAAAIRTIVIVLVAVLLFVRRAARREAAATREAHLGGAAPR